MVWRVARSGSARRRHAKRKLEWSSETRLPRPRQIPALRAGPRDWQFSEYRKFPHARLKPTRDGRPRHSGEAPAPRSLLVLFRGFGNLCGSSPQLKAERVPASRSRRATHAAANRAAAAMFSPPQAEMWAGAQPRGAPSRRTKALTRTRRSQRPSARDGGHCAGRTGALGALRAVISGLERDDGRRRPTLCAPRPC